MSTADPLEAETVIVPNPGVARWLWLYLAKEHGISANLDCVLPGSFIWRVFHRLLPGVPEHSPHEPAVMTWRLHRLLRSVRGDPAFCQLLNWRDTKDDRRRFELAQRLATLFDQYIVYRPDWIEQWRDDGQPGWQQELWRRLAQETPEPDWMSLRRRLDGLDSEAVTAVMPDRVSLLGIPLLSPGYLEVMTWLSSHIDVQLFLSNPCREHWAHIVPERAFGRVAGIADEKALYIESGNALLASWGGQGRDLLDLVEEIESGVTQTSFESPGEDTLLHAVQTQILELRNPGVDGQATASLQPGDRSIQIHVCHGITRELEVLHDQLLALFDNNDTLSASDVIVMTPDIDAYSPFIDAVFATPNQIPFHIADISSRRGMPLIETFMGLFDLPQARFDATHVFSVLELPAVHRRFGIAESDLPQVQDWVRETGVRWGLDAGSRAEYGRDDAGLHSWRRGLDRLLLGFALPGENIGTFAGVLPHDNIEGSAALNLGGLAEFVSRLKMFSSALQELRTASEWADWLHEQLDVFFHVLEEQEGEAQTLRDAISSLAEYAELGGHTEAIDIKLVVDWVTTRLDSRASTRGFLGHGVTFCGIVPMRSVPFPVVCLIGLNDDTFPRIERPAGFDLIAKKPRRGDRSRRDDDRQAFLECLLNARDVFYMSYVGRGIRDDASIPPSVVVSEMVDYCNRSFVSVDRKPVGDGLITLHRVQAFSPVYFDGSDPSLFTYSDIVATPSDRQTRPSNFLSDILECDDVDLWPVSLDALIRFFKNPAKSLMSDRLGISYAGDADPVDTHDPVFLNKLEQWNLGEWMLRLREAGRGRDEVLEMARNSRYAPSGPAGALTLGKLMERVNIIHAGLSAFRPQDEPHAVTIDFRKENIPLTGRLGELHESGQYLWRFGKTRAHDRVALWIRHLVLNVAQPTRIDRTSYWYAEDGTLKLPPLRDAGSYLTDLVQLYERGMKEGLPFFSESSWVYVSELAEKADAIKALEEAKKKYHSTRHIYSHGDNSNPYINRVFSNGVDWDHFGELAMRVYGPLNEHLQS